MRRLVKHAARRRITSAFRGYRVRKTTPFKRTIKKRSASTAFRFPRNRKDYNYNARLKKRRTNLTTSTSYVDSDIDYVFKADQVNQDPIQGLSSSTLLSHKVFNWEKKIDFHSLTGTGVDKAVSTEAVILRLSIYSRAPLTQYVRVALVRDKYNIFPGFRKQGIGGITIVVTAPGGRSNPYEVDMFKSSKMDRVQNFHELDQTFRTISPLNPYRYTVIHNRVYKIAGQMYASTQTNYLATGTMKDFHHVNTRIPYKKKLIIGRDSKKIINDSLILLVFTSCSKYNQLRQSDPAFSQEMLRVQGKVRMIYTGDTIGDEISTTLADEGANP